MNTAYPGSRLPRRDFWSDIGKIFAYAFTKEGAATLVVGGIFFGIASFVAQRAFCVGFAISVIVTSYLLTYEFKIIGHTAQGKEDVPMWPDPQGIFESAFLVLGVYAVCFGPSVACLILAFAVPLAAIPLVLLALLLFLVGSVYYPMAYLMNALFASPFAAFNVGFGFRSMAVIAGEYAVVVLLSLAFLATPIVATIGLNLAGVVSPGASLFVSIFGVFVTSFISLYLRLANGFMLGRLYYCTEERLNWFPGTEKKILGPPPQVYGGQEQRMPANAPLRAEAPARPAPAMPVPGLDEPPEPLPRRAMPDRASPKWAPAEDPFTKFRDQKIAEAPKKEPGWSEIFDRAKKTEEPPPPRAEEPKNLGGRKTGFYQAPQARPDSPAEPRDLQRKGAATKRATGAIQVQPQSQPAQGAQWKPAETQPFQDAGMRPMAGQARTEARGRPTGSIPKTPPDQPVPPQPVKFDDHAGPVKFSAEVQALVDKGEFEEAKKIVTQKREGAKNRGNLAEISFYRKQLDIIEMMEKV